MIEYTTPDFVFRIKSDDVNLLMAEHVYLTLKQGTFSRTYTDGEIGIGEKEVSLWLNQEEISMFKSDGAAVEVQLNWTYKDFDQTRTKRAATTIRNFRISRNLLQKVIE